MAKPKFSDPSLMVKCPSCGVPKGCACRVMDTYGQGNWGTPREPHTSRRVAYSIWKVKTFGPAKVLTIRSMTDQEEHTLG